MPSRSVIIAGLLIATCGGYALAQETFTAWGHEFNVTNFAPQQMMVAVATDPKTGRKFNVIKSKGGKMMVVSLSEPCSPCRRFQTRT